MDIENSVKDFMCLAESAISMLGILSEEVSDILKFEMPHHSYHKRCVMMQKSLEKFKNEMPELKKELAEFLFRNIPFAKDHKDNITNTTILVALRVFSDRYILMVSYFIEELNRILKFCTVKETQLKSETLFIEYRAKIKDFYKEFQFHLHA